MPQDFLPIGFVAENPMFIAVSPSLGISTLPALIARAKKAPGVAGAARSGSIKLIAVASAKRLAEFPDVPTVAETIPGFQATTSDWCSSPAAQASFAAPGRESLCEQAIAVGELDATARSG